MSSSLKKHFVRAALDPRRMPKSKIPPAKLKELARRTADWEQNQDRRKSASMPKPK